MNILQSMLGDIQSAHCDMIDVRNVLSKQMLNKPKDNEGTECTIGMCLDDTIDTLSELESMAEESYKQEVTSTEEVSEDPETKSILLEAAWFAFRHHYEELAEHLDLSDEVLQPIKEQLDKQLNN